MLGPQKSCRLADLYKSVLKNPLVLENSGPAVLYNLVLKNPQALHNLVLKNLRKCNPYQSSSSVVLIIWSLKIHEPRCS